MIITRTPFRISFFGGGTDYPVWFREHEGAVLATTINKYCYITVRHLPPFFDYKSRIVWSKIENVRETSEIEHPSVRTTLQFLDVKEGVAMHHDADLPARSGLGSSSTFTVGLLNALYGLRGKKASKQQLADEAIHVEQTLLQENVGSQDQVMAAHGGFNHINFGGDQVHVSPVVLPQERLTSLQNHLLLFYTGVARTASNIAKSQIEATRDKTQELKIMYKMVGEGMQILKQGEITDFGKLLNESWQLKRSLTNKISTPFIDEMYDAAMQGGALGGKLLGAGGGGFLLVFARPENHAAIKKKLKNQLYVPFEFESLGSQIVFYNQPPKS